MSGSKSKYFPKTGVGVVADTTKSLTWDVLRQTLTVISPDASGIVFDAASTSNYEASLSTYGWSHICSGANRILFVGVSILVTGTVTSITYNNVNLTKIRSDVTGVYRSELWYLIAPTIGSNTITVNLDASVTSVAGAASYNNVHQTSPIEANSGNTGTNNPATNTVVTATDQDWVVDNIATSAPNINPDIGVQRWNAAGLLGSGAGSDRGPLVISTVTVSWKNLGALDSWAISATAIRPVTAAALPGTGGGNDWPILTGNSGFFSWRF